MLDFSKPRIVYTEEEAKKEVENSAASFAIEGMIITEAEKQVAIDFLTGKISKEEYNKRFLEA